MQEEFRVWFDEETNRWYAQSQDLQREGSFGADIFEPEDSGLEAVMALADALGYDTAILAEKLDLI